MSVSITKAYASLPDYADVEYVDGKLKVARGIISRTKNPDLKRRWWETVDILLDQRAALVEVYGAPPAVPADGAGGES